MKSYCDLDQGLTDFERALADVCIGWIGKELGWKEYIKDNADALLKIAIKKFNAVQDAPLDYEHATITQKDFAPEPKFHEGDWVVLYPSEIEANRKVVQITRVERCQLNMYWTTEGTWFSDGTDARPWIIEDAKDGDVLVDVYGNISIYEQCDDFDWMSYCSLGHNGGFQHFRIEHENEKTYPATKEQHDLLFQKMKDAGYEWNGKEVVPIKDTIIN